jgi:hypothetical protein
VTTLSPIPASWSKLRNSEVYRYIEEILGHIMQVAEFGISLSERSYATLKITMILLLITGGDCIHRVIKLVYSAAADVTFATIVDLGAN